MLTIINMLSHHMAPNRQAFYKLSSLLLWTIQAFNQIRDW